MDAIRSIPIGNVCIPDRIVWPWSANGQYSVNSGYHKIHAICSDFSGGSAHSSHIINPAVWKELWNLAYQPKIKLFLWRLLSCSLATYQRSGLFCSSRRENAFVHPFHSSKLGRFQKFKVWDFIQCKIGPCRYQLKVRSWLKNKSEFTTKGRGLIFTFALDPEKFKTGTGSPPRRGWFKVNFDAAWKKDTNRAGIGVMIRDSKGLLCGGSAESMICHSMLEAKAEAALGGLKLALLSNYRKVTMETDSLVLKAGVDGKLENRAWKILPILLEIRRMEAMFEAVEWSWILRKKNLAAHAAASFGSCTKLRPTCAPFPAKYTYIDAYVGCANLTSWCSGSRGCASTLDVLRLDAVRLCAGVPARSTVRRDGDERGTDLGRQVHGLSYKAVLVVVLVAGFRRCSGALLRERQSPELSIYTRSLRGTIEAEKTCVVEPNRGKWVVKSAFGIVKHGGVTPINPGKSRPPP
ncbi:unnamed protein product [Prunus armeniaca]